MVEKESRIEAVTSRLGEMTKRLDEDLDRTLKDEAMFEAGRLKKEDIPAFVRYWKTVYPPAWWQHPDGSVELESIWVLEMRDNPAIENGRETYEALKEYL